MKLNIVNFQKFQNIGHKFQKNQPFNLIISKCEILKNLT